MNLYLVTFFCHSYIKYNPVIRDRIIKLFPDCKKLSNNVFLIYGESSSLIQNKIYSDESLKKHIPIDNDFLIVNKIDIDFSISENRSDVKELIDTMILI